jgi:hypothetical protein
MQQATVSPLISARLFATVGSIFRAVQQVTLERAAACLGKTAE